MAVKKILGVAFTALVICLVAAATFFACRYFKYALPGGEIATVGWTLAKQLDFAETLANKGLKKEAITAFEEYLGKAGLQLKQAARLFYRLGNLYMDLYDYEKAVYYFYKAEAADPGADFNTALNQKLVKCLESIGMSSQARYETQKGASATDAIEEKAAGGVVAIVGDKVITQEQIDAAFNEMPEWMRNNFASEEGKLDFIKQYAANEAMYQRAKRMRLDEDADVRRGVDRFKKQILIQKLIQQQLAGKVSVSPEDVKLYYEANKEKYRMEKKQDDGSVIEEQRPFGEVSELVEYEYRNEKTQDEMQKLLNSTMQEEGVRIYEERILQKKPQEE